MIGVFWVVHLGSWPRAFRVTLRPLPSYQIRISQTHYLYILILLDLTAGWYDFLWFLVSDLLACYSRLSAWLQQEDKVSPYKMHYRMWMCSMSCLFLMNRYYFDRDVRLATSSTICAVKLIYSFVTVKGHTQSHKISSNLGAYHYIKSFAKIPCSLPCGEHWSVLSLCLLMMK